jgi:hypothetical protein
MRSLFLLKHSLHSFTALLNFKPPSKLEQRQYVQFFILIYNRYTKKLTDFNFTDKIKILPNYIRNKPKKQYGQIRLSHLIFHTHTSVRAYKKTTAPRLLYIKQKSDIKVILKS